MSTTKGMPNFPPVGSNRRYLVYGDNTVFAGFDQFQQAKDVCIMYKKPGDRKRKAACKNETMNWTVRDTQNNSTVFTAPEQRNRQ